MFELDDQSACLALDIFERFRDGVDWRGGNFCGGEYRQPFVGRFRRECLLHDGNQYGAIFYAQSVGLEIADRNSNLRCVSTSRKFLPERLGSHTNDEISSVAAAKHFVRNDTGMRVAPAGGNDASVQVTAPGVGQPSKLRIKERHVEKLPVARFYAPIARREFPSLHKFRRSCRRWRWDSAWARIVASPVKLMTPASAWAMMS